MATIRDTYAEYLLEQLLIEQIKTGSPVTTTSLLSAYDSLVEDLDLSQPLFDATGYQVEKYENSSASLYNSTNDAILQDLVVLYKHLFVLGGISTEQLDRWKNEAHRLEIQLQGLEDRIAALLLIAEDTEGYFNYVQDDFLDASKVDVANTTASIDFSKGAVTVGSSATTPTRIDLAEINTDKIEFAVLSKNYLSSIVSATGSKLTNVVSDKSQFWQDKVYTTRPGAVTAELKVRFESTQTISRIDVDLHTSSNTAPIQITPMYSTDNYNYRQLPSTDFTLSVKDKATFSFSAIQASEIKFIMTKAGHDRVVGTEYVYEFGMDEVVFLNVGYSSTTSQQTGSVLYTDTLSILDTNGEPEEFARVAMEVCELVPDNTLITYTIAASNQTPIPTSGVAYMPIDPLNRSNPTYPTVVDFGDSAIVTISGVYLSYNANASDARFINPAESFSIIQSTSGEDAVIASGNASERRYVFANSNERILDHVVSSGVIIASDTLEIWRNVNQKGTSIQVRGQINGWGFNDPYYKTTVYVSNATGATVDFGSEKALVDGIAYTGTVTIAQGSHQIQVHKRNWKEISGSVVDLTTLKAADNLYPYNHRYIVEGYNYLPSYPSTDEKIYKGFDIMAEYLMKEVSVFDMVHNVLSADYEKFAIDSDVRDPSGTIDGISEEKEPMGVYLLKVDESHADFANELFTIRFQAVGTFYKYLKLRAELKTSDSTVTPLLDGYQIRVSN